MKRSGAIRSKRLSGNEQARRREVRERVFARDRGCLLASVLVGRPCSGIPTVHHLHKASAGGGYSLDNLVWLCASMNLWVEDNPDRAWALGLVKRHGDTLDDCWDRMRASGLVTYGAAGA